MCVQEEENGGRRRGRERERERGGEGRVGSLVSVYEQKHHIYVC